MDRLCEQDSNSVADDQREESADTNSTSPVVQVGQYTVEASLAATLEAIFERYGDIAKDCPVQSQSARSRFLEDLVTGIQQLQQVEFIGVRTQHLQSLHTVVTNAESVGLNVAWLRQRYDDLTSMCNGVTDYTTLKSELDRSEVVAEFTRTRLDYEKAKLTELEYKMEAVKGQLACLQEEEKVLETEMSHHQEKVDKFLNKSLDEGLL